MLRSLGHAEAPSTTGTSMGKSRLTELRAELQPKLDRQQRMTGADRACPPCTRGARMISYAKTTITVPYDRNGIIGSMDRLKLSPFQPSGILLS